MNYRTQLEKHINTIPDFPKKGVSFKDIQPLLENPLLFTQCILSMGKLTKNIPDYWVGIESRGFIFASALSMRYRTKLKLIRKPGKLPPPTMSESYDLEYGSDTLEMAPGTGTVVIVDDVYATGGTMEAAAKLCEKSGYTVVDKIALIDLLYLHDGNTSVKSLIQYE